MWNAGAMRWLSSTSAGLSRRYAPRNDKGEKGRGVIWGRGLIGLMDCHIRTMSFLAMTK
jgi:hypothetical protein